MECCCFLRNVQDLLADRKTPHEWRFGESFKGPIILYGAMVEYYPISARDQARFQQFGKKVLPAIFLGYALIAGGIWEGDILIADIEELENLDASEIIECKKSLDNSEKRRICTSCGRWFSKIVRKRLRIPGTHFKTGADREERERERVSVEILKAKWKNLNRQNRKMTVKPEEIFVLFKLTLFIDITLNRDFNCMCQKKKHLLFH